MLVLGIETSCDETSVAIIDDKKNILSHVLHSQIKLHDEFGGVVPELAARSHLEILDGLVLQALKDANLKFEDIDGFASTAGPGLIGAVIVGLTFTKTLASIYKKPFLAVNHLAAHCLTPALVHDEIKFPYLALLISGGHCQILIVNGISEYEKLGETIDDALGEAFDKVAQMLGLGYPGGAKIEKLALDGDENRFKFPRPLIDGKENKSHLFDFSFSGLKTAVRREIEKLTGESFSHSKSSDSLSEKDKRDICASFQKTVCEIIKNRIKNVMTYKSPEVKSLVLVGGVSANRYIFSNLENFVKDFGLKIFSAPINLCTDNGAMIAYAGIEKLKAGLIDDIQFKPMAKWSL